MRLTHLIKGSCLKFDLLKNTSYVFTTLMSLLEPNLLYVPNPKCLLLKALEWQNWSFIMLLSFIVAGLWSILIRMVARWFMKTRCLINKHGIKELKCVGYYNVIKRTQHCHYCPWLEVDKKIKPNCQTKPNQKNWTITNSFEAKLKQFSSVWFNGSIFFSEKLVMVSFKTIKPN
jgi:hypothetical protein